MSTILRPGYVMAMLTVAMIGGTQACEADRTGAVSDRSQRNRQPYKAERAFENTDTIALKHLLAERQYQLKHVAAREDGYYSVVVEQVTTKARKLLALRIQSDSLILLHTPLALGEYDPTSVHWFRSSEAGSAMLAITFDYPEVAEVGTVAFTVKGDTMVRTYVDAKPTCKPAEIRDVDKDGRRELVSYLEDPSGGDCATECHLALREQFDLTPAWVQVHDWTGQKWEPAEQRYPLFYARLAKRYEEVERWLQSPIGQACKGSYWLRGQPLFRNWFIRANTVATGK